MNLEKRTLLSQLSEEDLKQELSRRRVLERARRHLPSAEAALQRAQQKVDTYREVLREEETRRKIKEKRVSTQS
jgi:hypothetical protein